uniref:Uncharacterized protein n=1 Tax=Populus trichocarpa TaxID=3694 RepID=A0A3N7EKW2_POPTR
MLPLLQANCSLSKSHSASSFAVSFIVASKLLSVGNVNLFSKVSKQTPILTG